MRIAYETWNPRGKALDIVEKANAVCREYRNQGYDLTLRQLYYQFVARDWIPNTPQSYKNLGEIINRARLAGLLDWDYIVDRTRNLKGTPHWSTPESIIDSAASSYRIDKWTTQKTRIEVWIEKEALAGIVERVANRNDVDFFSCRGYPSQSETWAAAQRHRRYIQNGQNVVVLHLGDHDPSGLDMTRDIRERLQTFISGDLVRLGFRGGYFLGSKHRVHRIALNMEQIEQYGPPPNPAKLTDARATDYVERFGYESWELDALDPSVLDDLIQESIDDFKNEEAYSERQETESRERSLLEAVSDRWSEVVEFIDN